MNKAPRLPAEAFGFLHRLGRNNTTEWFNAHKDEYRTLVREPMAALVVALNEEIRTFAPAYVTTKKNPLSRPNRDTRFSKDKSPYRTDVAVVFTRNGMEKHESAGFFLRVGPEAVELIAGTFMPGPDQLRRLRAHIDAGHAAFRKLTTGRALTKEFGTLRGDALVRVPAPYAPTNPAGDLLRMKQFYFQRTMEPEMATTQRFVHQVATAFRAATPFVSELDRALGNT